MSGKQTLLAFLGAALIIGNLVTNRSASTGRSGIIATIFNNNASQADLASGHTQIMGLIGEIGVLIFLVVIAGVSDSAANLALLFVVGLALVWALTQFGGVTVPGVGGSTQSPGQISKQAIATAA
jgi:amino acid transporter